MAATPTPLLDPQERDAPRALVAHALTLIGRIHRADAAAARSAETELAAWRQSSPERGQAAATALRIWNATGAPDLRTRVPVPPSAEQQRQGRRRVTGLLGAAGLLAAAGAGGRWYWLRPDLDIALRSGPGQSLAHTLPDGSRLDLAPRTALQVTLYRARREIRLDEGEARFGVAPDAQRPFTVATAHGRVRVVGTVFTVSAREGRMRVAVAEGRVAVWSGGASSDTNAAVLLQAGDAIESAAQGLLERSRVDADDVGAWAQGWMVFRNLPLPEAITRWNEHLGTPLRLVDEPALRSLRVTGRYALRDPQAFLAALPLMLPVRVGRAADGAVEVGARR